MSRVNCLCSTFFTGTVNTIRSPFAIRPFALIEHRLRYVCFSKLSIASISTASGFRMYALYQSLGPKYAIGSTIF